jgi:hypothetical protein
MSKIIPFPSSAPREVVFLPEGAHKIHAATNGKAKHSTVRVSAGRGPAIAARLQQDLARRQSANVRPWLDFEHKGGAAAALPKAFRYEPGRGVVLEVEWTDAGRRAIEGKDYSYFSPVFFLGDDGEPDGLPEKGAIGALVNEPAFREIPRIAASDVSHGFIERARSLVAAGDVPEIHAACAEVFAADASAYSQYLRGLRTGQTFELIEAEEPFEEADGELVAAIVDRIEQRGREAVAAGDASGHVEGMSVALQRNPALYQQLLMAMDAAPTAGAVRPSVLREIEEMRKASEPSPKEILDKIAADFIARGETESEDEARVMAFEQRPDLYQAWLDAGAEMLGIQP